MSQATRKIAPQAPEAEQSLLGAALLRQQVVDELRGYVDPSDFYKPAHQHIWATMLEMHDVGEVIDPVTVADRVKDVVETQTIHDCVAILPAISAYRQYAKVVVEASRRRKLIVHLATLTDRCYEESADEVLADVDPGGDFLIGRREGDKVKGLYRLDDFVAEAEQVVERGEWLAPHIFRPLWRCVIVAGEGVGKGTLMRSLGLHMAAGRDPWNPTSFIIPRRVLYVDAENPNTTILRQTRISNQDVDLVKEAADYYSIWHREGGINLRERRARAEFERVLQETRPEMVFAGPFYKLFRRKASEDLEQSTIEFLEVLDDFRVRYGFALMLEAHAPKGSGSGYREMNPRGSAALLGWPEFGITLEPVGNPLPDEESMILDVGRFRRDREAADWPAQLMRGQMGQRTAWRARWPKGRNHQGFATM